MNARRLQHLTVAASFLEQIPRLVVAVASAAIPAAFDRYERPFYLATMRDCALAATGCAMLGTGYLARAIVARGPG